MEILIKNVDLKWNIQESIVSTEARKLVLHAVSRGSILSTLMVT